MQARSRNGDGLVSLLGDRAAPGYPVGMNTHSRPAFTSLLVVLLMLTGCQTQPELVLVTAAEEAPPQLPAQAVAKPTRAAANALLASLSPEQKDKATRPISDPLRKDWHFIPRERQGLPMGQMSDAQKTLLHKLMQTALSDSGYLKATDIIWLETVLAEMEKNPTNRDAGKYTLLIFGDPSNDKATWGWRLEGHHLSINLTYSADRIGVTPMFYGSNPAVVTSGALAGKRILADAHHRAVAFALSLSEEQRAKMMLAEKPKDVITSPGREASLKEPVGISIDQMTNGQQNALLELVRIHIDNLESEHAKSLYNRMVNLFGDAPLLQGYTFAWAGPIDADEPFYYRIQSPQFVIEYACQGKNHVHCVMHDLTDPLQDDLLKAHFVQHKHE